MNIMYIVYIIKRTIDNRKIEIERYERDHIYYVQFIFLLKIRFLLLYSIWDNPNILFHREDKIG